MKRIVISILGVILLFLASVQASAAPEKVIAKIGPLSITEKQFHDYLRFKKVSLEAKKKVDKKFNQYLEDTALSEEIKKTRYLDSSLIDAEIEAFRHHLYYTKYFDKYLDEKVTDKVVKKYFEDNPKKFQSLQVNPAHVLLRTNKNMSEAELQKVKEKADEAYKKLMSGVKFKQVVKEYSQDRITYFDGGDMGWLRRSAVAPEFTAVVFAMKKGEISKPFKTSYGYHIVKLMRDPKIFKATFDEAKLSIKEELKQTEKEKELARLKAKFEIKKLNR